MPCLLWTSPEAGSQLTPPLSQALVTIQSVTKMIFQAPGPGPFGKEISRVGQMMEQSPVFPECLVCGRQRWDVPRSFSPTAGDEMVSILQIAHNTQKAWMTMTSTT